MVYRNLELTRYVFFLVITDWDGGKNNVLYEWIKERCGNKDKASRHIVIEKMASSLPQSI